MKKLIFLLITSATLFCITSCNKESEPDIDALPNQNFKILKVEQTKRFDTPPFVFVDGNRFSAEFKYNNDIISEIFITKSNEPDISYPFILNRTEPNSLSMIMPNIFDFYCEIGSYLCGINKSTFKYNKFRLQSISFETRYTFGFGIGGQIRDIDFEYVGDKLNNVKTKLTLPFFPYFVPGNIAGELYNFEWEGNVIKKYKSDDYIGYVGLWGGIEIDTLIVRELVKEGKFNKIELTYKEAPLNIPKELIRKVNQVLSGFMRGPLEDYIYNWQVDFLYPGNNFLKNYVDGEYKNYVERLQTSDKTILADWLWSFAHPSFNVLPEQDKLIASKRITGRKIVDIIDDQPVYQEVDSIATFPFVFDPVAKTLEIAGLKIWYEVVD